MKMTFLPLLALVVALAIPAPAVSQEFPAEPYDFLMARAAAEEGDYDLALERIDRVIKRNPDDPVVLYERAMMLMDAGRIDRAEVELRALAAKHPDFYDANRMIGRILLEQASDDRSKAEEALRYLQAAFRANPDDLSSGMAVSQILSSLGRLEEAERVLSVMVERSPDQRGISYTYSQILSRLGRRQEAQKYLERTVAIDPAFPPAVMQLLDIYQEANEWQKAADVLEPLVGGDSENAELRRQHAFFYLRAGDAEKARERFEALVKADPNDARSLYYLAEALNDLEEYARSEELFRKLLAATPNDADLLASLGLSLAGQKKWEEATRTFNSALAVPEAPENIIALARTQLAWIDLQQGNLESAVSKASAVTVYRDRPNVQAVNIAFDALKKQDKPAELVTLLTPLLEKFPKDPFVNARYVEALVRTGQKQKAREHADAQLKLGTRNAISVAEAYVQAGEHAAAIEVVKGAIAAKTDDVDLQFELGSLHERAGDPKSAEKVFLALLEKKPDHAPTLNYLGYMWAEQGVNLERAHEMLTRAVGQEPNNGAYVDSLGWVYFRLGNLDLAEKYLTDARRLAPRDATVAEHLGDVLAKRGDMARALQEYRTALSLDPQSKDVEKIRSKIAELEQKGPGTTR